MRLPEGTSFGFGTFFSYHSLRENSPTQYWALEIIIDGTQNLLRKNRCRKLDSYGKSVKGCTTFLPSLLTEPPHLPKNNTHKNTRFCFFCHCSSTPTATVRTRRRRTRGSPWSPRTPTTSRSAWRPYTRRPSTTACRRTPSEYLYNDAHAALSLSEGWPGGTRLRDASSRSIYRRLICRGGSFWIRVVCSLSILIGFLFVNGIRIFCIFIFAFNGYSSDEWGIGLDAIKFSFWRKHFFFLFRIVTLWR